MRHPLLYQLNTHVTLEEVAHATGRPPSFDGLPDALLDQLQGAGFQWLWLLGVWQTSPAGLAVSKREPRLRRALAEGLPDLQDEDIVCSPFAIRGYTPREPWGGAPALARLRERVSARGLRLLLDFVPNHVALDHPWVDEHPEYLVSGTPEELAHEPLNYVALTSRGQRRIFAHGRDPYFPGWPDTLQLDYRRAALRRTMTEQLRRIAQVCDGVRCDMAMLVLPDIFASTWGERGCPSAAEMAAGGSFWSEAITTVRAERPGFVFMAEAYWDLEWRLQQEGFDFTYDKKLYDRLQAGSGRAVREHLLADAEFQRRSVHFLENHDEPRAAAAFPADAHHAAALVTYLAPGMRLFHDGQLEGRKRRVSMHVGRRAAEPPDDVIRAFYARLLECLARTEVHAGDFVLHDCRPAWHANTTHENLIAFSWMLGERRLLVAVNLAPHPAQGFVSFEVPVQPSQVVLFSDVMSPARYERQTEDLSRRGLYLDVPAWGHHVFECRSSKGESRAEQTQSTMA
jgi:glycosidase